MNERIREIWETNESISVVWPETGSPVSVSAKTLEKFAELIVKRCLDEVSTRAFVSGDRAWSDDADRHWVELEFGFGRLAKLKKK